MQKLKRVGDEWPHLQKVLYHSVRSMSMAYAEALANEFLLGTLSSWGTLQVHGIKKAQVADHA